MQDPIPMTEVKKPASVELFNALDTIRDEIAYSKNRNISERQKNLDNPLHAKLPYLTWEHLQECVRELELRVSPRLTEESLGESATIEGYVLKRSANMELVLEHIHAHRKDGTDLSSKGISTALSMHILSVRSCVEKLVAAGAVAIANKGGGAGEFKDWVLSPDPEQKNNCGEILRSDAFQAFEPRKVRTTMKTSHSAGERRPRGPRGN